jgi:ABC-type uncharacterized transport system substrate-binding protein
MNSKLGRALLLLLLAAPAAAGEPLAVLSAGTGAYMEAFSAFQAAYGSEVPYLDMAREKPVIPADTSLIVAFGGKAANYSYPAEIPVIYCMAPGLFVKPDAARGHAAKISLIPDFGQIFAQLKEIQPGLKRLRAFWMNPAFAQFTEPFKAAGAALGIEVSVAKVPNAEDLPALLRQVNGNADALWLPPDPLLISPENLMILRDFSWANGIPFYGSTKGMTREGAAASVGVSFSDMGATAAEAARRLQAGESLPDLIFPPKMELTLNASAGKKCGLRFSPEVLKKANYLFP